MSFYRVYPILHPPFPFALDFVEQFFKCWDCNISFLIYSLINCTI